MADVYMQSTPGLEDEVYIKPPSFLPQKRIASAPASCNYAPSGIQWFLDNVSSVFNAIPEHEILKEQQMNHSHSPAMAPAANQRDLSGMEPRQQNPDSIDIEESNFESQSEESSPVSDRVLTPEKVQITMPVADYSDWAPSDIRRFLDNVSSVFKLIPDYLLKEQQLNHSRAPAIAAAASQQEPSGMEERERKPDSIDIQESSPVSEIRPQRERIFGECCKPGYGPCLDILRYGRCKRGTKGNGQCDYCHNHVKDPARARPFRCQRGR